MEQVSSYLYQLFNKTYLTNMNLKLIYVNLIYC